MIIRIKTYLIKAILKNNPSGKTPAQAAQEIMLYLLREGYIDTDDDVCAEDGS